MTETPDNIHWQQSATGPSAREALFGQRGCVVWLTGLSGSGKSTIGAALEAHLVTNGRAAFCLDGDNLRHGLCSNLGFSSDDRDENIRRVSCVAGLFADAGLITICAFISPMQHQRVSARDAIGSDRFFEVFVDTPLDVCEARDPKGLYVRARRGEIEGFTGVGSEYEPPIDPALRIDTEELEVTASVERILEMLSLAKVLGP